MSKSWLIDMLARRYWPQRCDEGVARFGETFLDELAAEVERKLLTERVPERIQQKMETLALLKMRMNRYDDAERIYAELLFRRVEAVGRRHPSLIDCLTPLSKVCELQGKTDRARDLRALAHQIREFWGIKPEPKLPSQMIQTGQHYPAIVQPASLTPIVV